MIKKIFHSIVIVTFNQEDVILKTLQSVLGQTILPDQIIIVDDCSSDSTASVLENFLSGIKFTFEIKVVVNQVNLGIQKNVLKGCHLASGNVLTLMGGDDLLMPNTIELVQAGINRAKLDPCVDKFVSYSPVIERKSPDYDKCIEYKILKKSPFKTALRKTAPFVKIGFSKSVFEDVIYPDNLGIWADWLWDVSICSKEVKFYEIPYPCHVHVSGIGVSSTTPTHLINLSYEVVAAEILNLYKSRLSFSDKFYLLGEIFYLKGTRLNSPLYKVIGFLFFLCNLFNYGGLVGFKSAFVRYFPYFVKQYRRIKA